MSVIQSFFIDGVLLQKFGSKLAAKKLTIDKHMLRIRQYFPDHLSYLKATSFNNLSLFLRTMDHPMNMDGLYTQPGPIIPPLLLPVHLI